MNRPFLKYVADLAPYSSYLARFQENTQYISELLYWATGRGSLWQTGKILPVLKGLPEQAAFLPTVAPNG
jgi:hypothetical protein